MRLSRKQQSIIRQEHGVDGAGYGESLRLAGQNDRTETAQELAPILEKVRSPRVRQ